MTSPTPPIRRLGRPADADRGARRDEILDVAEHLLLARGYGSITMDLLAAQARVAKRTIYQQIGDKQEVFLAIIDRITARVLDSLHPPGLSEPVHLALHQFGTRLLETMLSDQAIGFERLVITQATEHPDVAARFYEHGPGRGLLALTDFISDRAAAGELAVTSPHAAASHLFNLLLGELWRQRLLNILPAVEQHRIDQQVHEAVDIFLSHYAAEP